MLPGRLRHGFQVQRCGSTVCAVQMAPRRLRARLAMRRSPSWLPPDSPSARTSALPQMTPSAPQARSWRACGRGRMTRRAPAQERQ